MPYFHCDKCGIDICHAVGEEPDHKCFAVVTEPVKMFGGPAYKKNRGMRFVQGETEQTQKPAEPEQD
jgi:hypothetical protein